MSQLTLRNFCLGPLCLLFLCSWLCRPQAKAPAAVTLFAASSTTAVVSELAQLFETKNGCRVRLNFAASSTLARQIAAGAPADLYISANPYWTRYLQKARGLPQGAVQDLIRNRLVLVGSARTDPPDSGPLPARPPASWRRLAMADPGHVPAGEYGRQALTALGWWQPLSQKMLYTQSVKAALRLVELGEADVGIVYATDAQASEYVRRLWEFPPHSHEEILYQLALCDRKHPQAEAFFAFLRSPEAAEVFEKHGFTAR